MNKNLFIAEYKSPIGSIEITTDKNYVYSVEFIDNITADKNLPDVAKNCIKQLDEYFSGKRKTFELKLNTQGTDFRKLVWQNLMKINYGETASYKDIAMMINNPKAVRAVGGANNKNPISIIIPCHRIIGSDGSLVGYGGGLERKKWLLNHEQKYK